jgi:C1A family cysteine protease
MCGALLLVPASGVAQAPPKKPVRATTPSTAGGYSNASKPTSKADPAPAKPAYGSKRPLSELRKSGLDRPPIRRKPITPRKPGLKSPNRRVLAVKLKPKEIEAAAARNRRYAEREAKAPPAVTEKLKKLRSKIASKKLSFQVGATSVSDKTIPQITGFTGEPDPKLAQKQKQKRLSLKSKSNLVRETMRERATPPPTAPKKGAERRDPGDSGTMADGKIIVTPDDARGAAGRWFPSSAMPSPTNPQFSWRDKLPPVRNQEFCGSCWAFAVLGAYEGSQALLNGVTLDLSEQQMVNCVPAHPSTAGDNCRGNMPAVALDWMSSSGPPTETALPYASRMSSCNAGLGKPEYRAMSWGFVSEDDPRAIPSEEAMKEAIAKHGPLSATVFVDEAFQSYTGGVFDESSPQRPNHAIVIAGWDDARRAWHVRNSWGTGWGEDGYIWVRYGTSSIGYLASWVDADKVSKPPPEDKLFKDRYVSLRNDTGEDLDVFVQAYSPSGSAFKWLPADPDKSSEAYKFRVAKGKVLDVKPPGSGTFLRAKKMRVWATSTDGKRSWNEWKTKSLPVVSKSYKAAVRDRFTQAFDASGRSASADDLLTEAHSLREAGKLAAARDKLQLFVESFPDDDRVSEARFWVGQTQNQEGKHWDAVQSLYEMATAAPDDDPNLGYAFFYMGDSYSSLGYCGYAVRSLEVVSLGDVDAPKEWVTAAKDTIKFLNKDDGEVCENWD